MSVNQQMQILTWAAAVAVEIAEVAVVPVATVLAEMEAVSAVHAVRIFQPEIQTAARHK